MGVDPLFGPLAVYAEYRPQTQAIAAHPFLWKPTGEALPFPSHTAPIVVIRHSGPWAPGLRGIENAQLAGTLMKAGE